MKYIAIVSIIIMCVSLVTAGDWPQYKCSPERHACNGSETISLPAELCAWFDFGSPILSSPAIVDNKAYVVADNGLVACIDLEANSVVWYRNLGCSGNSASPAVGNGRVYVALANGLFHVLSAESGEILNVYNAGYPIFASPLLVSSGVYFGSMGGVFHALTTDGELKWTYQVRKKIFFREAAFANGQIVFADGDFRIFWLEDSITYGHLVKYASFDSATTGFISGPMVWKDTIYIGFSEGEMYGTKHNLRLINFTTGSLIRYSGYSATAYTGASVDTATGKIFAPSANKGMLLPWASAPSYSAYPVGLYAINTPPAIIGNCVIFGSENNNDTGGCSVHFYNRTSSTASQLWSYKPSSYKAITGGPAAGSGKVLVGSMDGSLYGFWNGTAVSAPVKVDSTPSTEVNRSSIATPGRWTFTAYPNPASGNSVTFSMHGVSEEMILKIYSSNGRIVKVIGNNGNYTSFRTELKDNYGRILPSGNYLAVLYNGNGKQIKSFDMKIIR